MTAILRRPEASGRIGLLGFSLGGAVAIASARDRRVGAAVIFYGWGSAAIVGPFAVGLAGGLPAIAQASGWT